LSAFYNPAPLNPHTNVTNKLEQLLAQRPYLLADGATGTNLFAMGLQTGDAPELWNLEQPEKIARHYRSFIEAGADIVLTNSFGGTRYRLQLHDAQDCVADINQAAARIACDCIADCSRPVVIAGSMGPTGEILAPLGDLSAEDAAAAFAEQAAALAQGGVDVLWIETMSSKEELVAALNGAATAGLPTVCTMSFDTNGRTMMGISPSAALEIAQSVVQLPVACGANCGVGAADLVASLLEMSGAGAAGGVFVAKANCGIPKYVDGHIEYDGTPELMATYACLAYDAGARIIGGCCGTTPRHLAAMRAALDTHTRRAAPTRETIEAALGPVSVTSVTRRDKGRGGRRRSRKLLNPSSG
jgi:5-methyltetrahydrofolate--homocysteine methyltransferase